MTVLRESQLLIPYRPPKLVELLGLYDDKPDLADREVNYRDLKAVEAGSHVVDLAGLHQSGYCTGNWA